MEDFILNLKFEVQQDIYVNMRHLKYGWGGIESREYNKDTVNLLIK